VKEGAVRVVNVVSMLGGVLLLGASLAVAEQRATHPLEQAKAGQWVLHRIVASSGDAPTESCVYKWIDKVDHREVHLRIQPVSKDGRYALAAPTLTIVNLDKPPDSDDTSSATTEDEIAVKGRKVKCKRVEVVTLDSAHGKLTTTRWISDEVPIYGTVRSITVDREHREVSRTDLLDYGDSGGAEKPMPPPAPEDRLGPMKRD
jgi:hypothetical protein